MSIFRLTTPPVSTPAARRSKPPRSVPSSARSGAYGVQPGHSTSTATMVDSPAVIPDATRRDHQGLDEQLGGECASTRRRISHIMVARPAGSTRNVRRPTICPTSRGYPTRRPPRSCAGHDGRLARRGRRFGGKATRLALGPRVPAADAVVRKHLRRSRPPRTDARSTSCAASVCSPTSRWSNVPGSDRGYDNDYGAQRDAAIQSLRNGTDVVIIHVEASDEAATP